MHATIIAIEDDCHHESAHEYVAEQSASTECGDLCDMHHLFHFIAIVDTANLLPLHVKISEKYMQIVLAHTPPYKQTTIKPPIA